MKKFFKTLLVFGWFFAAQTPMQSKTSPEAMVTQVVGPFKTQTECEATASETEDLLKSIGMTVRMIKCVFKQEA